MKEAPLGQEFIFRDGSRAKNLAELLEHLKSSGQDEFYGFVNQYKNDFANWIEYVLGDKTLSAKLRAIKDIGETIKVLESAILLKSPDASLDLETIRSASANMHGLQEERKSAQFAKGEEHKEIHTDNIKDVSRKDVSTKNDAMQKKVSEETSDDSPYTSGREGNRDKAGREHSKNWFRIAERKIAERKEKKEDNARHASESQGRLKSSMHHVEEGPESERILWTIIYFVVVALIIALALYKFVLN